MTKVEKKVRDIEEWIADFQEGNDEKLVFSNMNFLVNQLKNIGDRLSNVEKSHIQLEQALQQNAKVVQDFIGDNELEKKWNAYLEDLKEDTEDATEEGKEAEDDK
jgi:Mg2+ and Co2+ transporter CorA